MNATVGVAPAKHPEQHTKLDWAIVASACLFLFALAVSAYFEPAIRVLHAFQALIYLAVIAGSLRHQKWAYGAGICIAALWNYINLFITTFIADGVETLRILFSGGQPRDAGTVIAIPAALGHFGMIVFCAWAYTRLNKKRWSDVAVMLGSGVLAIGYFAGIIVLFGRQYLPLLRVVFHV